MAFGVVGFCGLWLWGLRPGFWLRVLRPGFWFDSCAFWLWAGGFDFGVWVFDGCVVVWFWSTDWFGVLRPGLCCGAGRWVGLCGFPVICCLVWVGII